MGEVVRLPNVVLRTVAKPIGRGQPPGRKSNEEHGRTREWLSEAEIEKVMATAASHGRYGHRDSTLILMAYRHALRVSELVWLRWSQIDLKGGKVAVPRAKNGIASVHPLTGRELRVLRRLQREQSPGTEFLFMSQRGAPMAPAAAQKVVREAGKRADMPFPIHIHMLRHSCGYALINRGSDVRTVQAYMGHASISNTVIYTRLDATRFNGIWRD